MDSRIVDDCTLLKDNQKWMFIKIKDKITACSSSVELKTKKAENDNRPRLLGFISEVFRYKAVFRCLILILSINYILKNREHSRKYANAL